MKDEEIKEKVMNRYGQIVRKEENGCGCGCSGSPTPEEISLAIGYSKDEMDLVPEANLGLGCGNPTALGEIKEGSTVLDLGSGAGLDCFLAARKVGSSGKVIGVDMTPDMIEQAQANAAKHGFGNVEFRLGDIENLPIESDTVDIIISNCVINLAPDKGKVFREVHRIMRPDARMFVSDIVLLKPLPEVMKENEYLLTGCVAGALLKDDYLKTIKEAGLEVEKMDEDKEISKRQYAGIALESLKLVLKKR